MANNLTRSVSATVTGALVLSLSACMFAGPKKEDILQAADTFAQTLISRDAEQIAALMVEGAASDAEDTLNEMLDTSGYTDNDAAYIDAVADTITYKIDEDSFDAEKDEALSKTLDAKERIDIEKKYEEERKVKVAEFKKSLDSTLDDLVNNAGQDIVERVLTDQQNQKKKSVEDAVKDHLRGFSRTIPAFLMAYGLEGEVTLQSFDTIIPADVFKEVTSISLDDFRFLRDGGTYINEETGQEESFEGHLFDPVVFNDSVNVFLSLRKKLANYFDESATQDIFDFIPPQRTNQIFTPRKVVIQMVDTLEQENPGCFDDDSKTFADLYMKSGLYLAEIVKRLYRSDKMKAKYPDEQQRLDHIFSKQVFGLAPTEIIYRIVLSFLLGFSEDVKISKNNIRLCDSLLYAKDGSLEEKLKEVFDF